MRRMRKSAAASKDRQVQEVLAKEGALAAWWRVWCATD